MDHLVHMSHPSVMEIIKLDEKDWWVGLALRLSSLKRLSWGGHATSRFNTVEYDRWDWPELCPPWKCMLIHRFAGPIQIMVVSSSWSWSVIIIMDLQPWGILGSRGPQPPCQKKSFFSESFSFKGLTVLSLSFTKPFFRWRRWGSLILLLCPPV